MSNKYVVVSGTVFGVIAAAQVMRAVAQLPVHAGSVEIPVWASWVAAVVAGSLCVWAFSPKNQVCAALLSVIFGAAVAATSFGFSHLTTFFKYIFINALVVQAKFF